MRQERGGALIGTYEPHGESGRQCRRPTISRCSCCPMNSKGSRPYFEVGFEHFPALGRGGHRKAINGPFTFAPDGNPLVGPVRGLRNFWVACAVMAGFSQGGGIGLVLSRWMAEGDPGPGHPVDGRRALRRLRDAEVHVDQGAGELPRRFRLAYPNEELPPRGRCGARRSTSGCCAAGAVMGANFGSRACALVCAERVVFRSRSPTYRRSEAFPIVRAECQAVRSDVGIYETTNYGEVRGHGSRRSSVARSRLCVPDSATGPAGTGADAESCRPHRRGPVDRVSRGDRFLIVGSGFAEEFHLRWFGLRNRHPMCSCARPRRRCAAFRSPAPLPRRPATPRAQGPVGRRVQVLRRCRDGSRLRALHRDACRFHGRTGYEVWTTPDYFASLYDDLREAGRQAGMIHFGGRALSSLRLEKAYGSFNKIFGPTTRRARPVSIASSISRSRISRDARRRWPSAVPDPGGASS